MYSVRSRLFLISVIGVVCSIVITVSSALQSSRLLGRLADSETHRLAIRTQMEMDMMHDAVRADVYRFLLEADATGRRAARRDFDEHAGLLRQHLDELARMPLGRELLAEIESAGPALASYVESGQRLLQLAATDRDAAMQAIGAFQTAFEELEGRNEQVSDALSKDGGGDGQAEVRAGRLRLIVVGAAAAIASLLIAYLMGSRIARRVSAVARTLATLGKGDLRDRARIDIQAGRCEIGDMAVALDRALDQLSDTLRAVHEVSETVTVAARDLTGAAGDVAGGVQKQAASLEESAAAIEQMTATTRASADHARQADELAGGSRKAAEDGGTTVEQAVAAMSEINQSSRKIGDIISIIDEIAFQTNLLALNAAVEAARAGEHGRGFAVVAGEVRTLAQRSATAAREIKSLIGDSVRKVDLGSELVNRSGATLTGIVSSVKRVSDIVAQMTSAARETSSGLEQINLAVTEMDQATQASAAQAEEMATAAASLRDQAETLRELIARFRVDEEPGARVAVAERAPVPGVGAAQRPAVALPRHRRAVGRVSVEAAW